MSLQPNFRLVVCALIGALLIAGCSPTMEPTLIINVPTSTPLPIAPSTEAAPATIQTSATTGPILPTISVTADLPPSPSPLPVITIAPSDLPPAPTSTPLPQPTPSPLPTVAPTTEAQLDSELFFGTAGILRRCVEKPAKIPAIQVFRGGGDEGWLCVWAFPEGKAFELELISRDGVSYQDTFMIKDGKVWQRGRAGLFQVYSGEAGERSGTPFASITLWMPAGILHAGWRAVARIDQRQFEIKFNLPELGKPPFGKLSAYSTIGFDPFQSQPLLTMSLRCPVQSPGNTVTIKAEGFEAQRVIPIGVYQLSGTPQRGRLMSSTFFTTSDLGRGSFTVQIADSAPSGNYLVASPFLPLRGKFSDQNVGCYQVK